MHLVWYFIVKLGAILLYWQLWRYPVQLLAQVIPIAVVIVLQWNCLSFHLQCVRGIGRNPSQSRTSVHTQKAAGSPIGQWASFVPGFMIFTSTYQIFVSKIIPIGYLIWGLLTPMQNEISSYWFYMIFFWHCFRKKWKPVLLPNKLKF